MADSFGQNVSGRDMQFLDLVSREECRASSCLHGDSPELHLFHLTCVLGKDGYFAGE
jgi:hypothetical protein